jgi:acyl-CoA thioesterase FadM
VDFAMSPKAANLHARFVKPVPNERALIGTVRITERDGRRVHVHGERRLAGADEVLATSRALMI